MILEKDDDDRSYRSASKKQTSLSCLSFVAYLHSLYSSASLMKHPRLSAIVLFATARYLRRIPGDRSEDSELSASLYALPRSSPDTSTAFSFRRFVSVAPSILAKA
ncbi:hypothetical protein SERLADRAFT_438720 [Serpula lacrymans var. lacrymans S7.9]|uniref:Uncharacterized protein n=1 Tax=Serpula lacrymans var. lacrymans (strain S7.9) TaxID=578457 RepID=F8NZY2_SERL9|nr:uncharacterized protein SERLADRAFT_438720 [Serpula lacrymans var. lacrymans S7.9]EGO23409.1 hypothetical protein SERLADRAFT_438720 [Serpula lacrymans var. lacrymans S7.9]